MANKNFLGTCIVWTMIVSTPRKSWLKFVPWCQLYNTSLWKIEPGEYKSVIRKQSIRLPDNIILKCQKSGDSKILFALSSLVLCMTFSFMMGKLCRVRWWETRSFIEMCAGCCKTMWCSSWSQNYKVLFDNWFTTLDLLHHFRSKGINAVGIIWLNRLRAFPLDTNKKLIKNGRGAMVYHLHNNSRIMSVKWVDNSVVNHTSNFVEVEPTEELERWWACCHHCIEYHTKQRAGTKHILASHWYGKFPCLDPIPLSILSEWKTR